MSDTFEDVSLEALEEFEQAEQVDGADDFLAEGEELEFIDIDQFRDKYVSVKVGGEELRVPLSEAVAGYQRQADYTRKTQELAQQKADVQWATAVRAALESDPQGTVALLAEKFGVNLTSSSSQADMFDDPWGEPEDPKYREIEMRLRRFEEERAQQQLENTIRQLSQKYGDEFDPREVVSAAMAAGSTDLEATFKQIKFDKIMEDARLAKAEAAKITKKTAAKRDAGVVSGGSSAGSKSVEVGVVHSIADAWREAKRQLGA